MKKYRPLRKEAKEEVGNWLEENCSLIETSPFA